MKRVLIITYYWPPSGGAGVQRWLKFAKYLPGFDWEPVILTVDPEYATYPVRDHSLMEETGDALQVIRTKSSEWFSVYKKLSNTKEVPHSGFASESSKISLKQRIARFLRGNLFIPDPRRGWNKHAVHAARKLIGDTPVDLLVTTGPPHSTHLIGMQLSADCKIPWLADFRDPWTDIYYYKDFYPTRLADRLNRKLEKRVLTEAQCVLTVGPTFKKILSDKLDKDQEKIRIITNGFDPDDFQHLDKPDRDVFTITYVGSVADNYPLNAFLAAMEKLLHEHQDMRLRFVGTVSSAFQERIESLPPQQVEMIAYVEHRKAINFMSSSDVLLLVIPSHASSKGIPPGKLFEYMAVEKPILVLGPEGGDAANIIQASGAGTNLNGENETEIYCLLKKWHQDPPITNAQDAYSRENLTKALAGILDALAGVRHPNHP